MLTITSVRLQQRTSGFSAHALQCCSAVGLSQFRPLSEPPSTRKQMEISDDRRHQYPRNFFQMCTCISPLLWVPKLGKNLTARQSNDFFRGTFLSTGKKFCSTQSHFSVNSSAFGHTDSAEPHFSYSYTLQAGASPGIFTLQNTYNLTSQPGLKLPVKVDVWVH